jgi:hypothetical protein
MKGREKVMTWKTVEIDKGKTDRTMPQFGLWNFERVDSSSYQEIWVCRLDLRDYRNARIVCGRKTVGKAEKKRILLKKCEQVRETNQLWWREMWKDKVKERKKGVKEIKQYDRASII